MPLRLARAVFGFARDCLRDGVLIFWSFFAMAFPIVVAVRALDEWFNFTAHVGELLAPLMSVVGLPGDAGVIWATAIFVNVYSGMILTAELWDSLALTSAQATVLAVMMLLAHSLPVEVRIASMAGVRAPITLISRIGGAIILGAALSLIYEYGNWLQEPAKLLLNAAPSSDEFSWRVWAVEQAYNWALIFAVLTLLLMLIRIMKITHAERLVFWLFAPFLRLMGIGKRATTLTVTGMTLGLSYGGPLLIAEARSGHVGGRDILCAFMLLGLCHSVIEDTPALVLIGGHISGVLVARVVFAVCVMAVFSRVINATSEKTLNRYFLAN